MKSTFTASAISNVEQFAGGLKSLRQYKIIRAENKQDLFIRDRLAAAGGPKNWRLNQFSTQTVNERVKWEEIGVSISEAGSSRKSLPVKNEDFDLTHISVRRRAFCRCRLSATEERDMCGSFSPSSLQTSLLTICGRSFDLSIVLVLCTRAAE